MIKNEEKKLYASNFLIPDPTWPSDRFNMLTSGQLFYLERGVDLADSTPAFQFFTMFFKMKSNSLMIWMF